MKEWYQKHLGLNTNKYGAVFEWRQGADTTKKGFTQWSPFSEKTKYFEPSIKDFMINYSVENLEALVEELKKEGVTIADKYMEGRDNRSNRSKNFNFQKYCPLRPHQKHQNFHKSFW